ncbi:phytanoyl-CoA dioxygenase family protein [Microlunatus sp. GCM10028923]|uniref:phytanoyl-CoA dioxygenase family protein n=1 Tax=Microlunatus sp. GCM10028923 TaxID=3273400 RepID=UPI0036146146
MITGDQRDEFRRTGLLRLPGAIERPATRAMVDRIWEHLGREHGMQPDRPETWSVTRPTGLRPVTGRPEFRELGSPAIRAAFDGLLGAGRWTPPRRWGRLLITFPGPSADPWTVPQEVWHNDFTPLTGTPDPRAVQLFVILDDLAPRGGGTLVLTGSHRLVGPLIRDSEDGPHPRRLRDRLGRDRWLRELWRPALDEPAPDRIRRFMIDGGTVGDVDLRVVELTGAAGDAYLVHCDTFHCIAPNRGAVPRIMATTMIGHERDQDPASRPRIE